MPHDHPWPDLQKMLNSLSKLNYEALRAATLLEKLYGDPYPPTAAEVLTRCTFEVGEKKRKLYARLTTSQCDKLKKAQTYEDKFAEALAELIVALDNGVAGAILALKDGLDGITKAVVKAKEENDKGHLQTFGGGIPPPPQGCCTYDTGPKYANTSQPTCDSLGGTWSSTPCKFAPKPSNEEHPGTEGSDEE